MGKLLEKSMQESSLKFVSEIGQMMEKLTRMSGNERQEMMKQIIKQVEEYDISTRKQVGDYEELNGGKNWDFSNEKARDILVENDDLIIRNIRNMDKEKFIQIKEENLHYPEISQNTIDCEAVWEDTQKPNVFYCAVIRKKSNEFLGYVALKDTTKNLWEIAMEFLNEYCHMGYGAETLRLFLPTITEITNRTQFQALIEVDNIPSQRLAEKLGARLIDIYNIAFHSEESAEVFEEKHLNEITDRMIELAQQIDVEPRKLLSNVLDYRFFIENGEIANRAR